MQFFFNYKMLINCKFFSKVFKIFCKIADKQYNSEFQIRILHDFRHFTKSKEESSTQAYVK